MNRLVVSLLLALAGLAACTGPAEQKPPIESVSDVALTSRPATPAEASAKALRTAAYAGTYDLGGDVQREPTGHLVVYPESDSTVLFYLDVSNGPPAFHLGALFQRAVVRNGAAFCAFKEGHDENGCQLKLTFTPQAAVVETVRGFTECGFGQAVHADNTYPRVSAAIPRQFINAVGDTVKFSGLTPEKYKASNP